MLGFFGWPSGGGSSGASSTSYPVRPDGIGEADKLLLLLTSTDEDVSPLLQPLKGTLVLIAKAVSGRGVLDPAIGSELHAATSFLSRGENPERRLEVALANYRDVASTQRLCNGIEAILRSSLFQSQLQSSTRAACTGQAETVSLGASVDDMIARWHQEVGAFRSLCKEVWELHFYLVFLEVKADRVLFEQTARKLCATLDIPGSSLNASLLRSRRWVEEALDKLATQSYKEMLIKCHSTALREWLEKQDSQHSKTEEFRNTQHSRAGGAAPEDEKEEALQQGVKFWESYFTQLFKITWPDFVEAFENFYLVGRCPWDIVTQLRLRLDPGCRYQVLRASWEHLLKDSKIRDLVPILVDEVLEDVGSRIYRPEILKQYEPCELGASSPKAVDPSPSPRGVFRNDPSQAAAWRSRPRFPFGQSMADDNDMSVPTPHDAHDTPLIGRPDPCSQDRGPMPTMAWDDWVAGFCAQSTPWWLDTTQSGGHESLSEEQSEALGSFEPRRLAALRAVDSCMAYTRRALVFRVIAGDLGQGNPILELPGSSIVKGVPEGGSNPDSDQRPCLVVTANGTRFSGVTKFGRGSSRRTLLPDCPMTEPIASRSHFNVVYQQESNRYYLMDAGSKWGTFVKIVNGVTLACGDWIRVGGVEFIVRYCGGGCSCQAKHAHYRLHSLRLLREHQVSTSAATDLDDEMEPQVRLPNGRPVRGMGNDSDSDEEEEGLQDELVMMLSSRRPCGWMTSSARLCQQSAMQTAGLPDVRIASKSSRPMSQKNGKPSGRSKGYLGPLPTEVPIEPLELDFISGPRMGEKIVLSDRICTLGRGEGNTIQVNDSQLVSVSRVHCIFEYRGNRWHMRDNNSTNGTWKRLSCVLEPSDPIALQSGMSIQAGVHEFLVEEAEMRQWWVPSTPVPSFDELGRAPSGGGHWLHSST